MKAHQQEKGNVVHVCIFEIEAEHQTRLNRLEAMDFDKNAVINKCIRLYFEAMERIACKEEIALEDAIHLSVRGGS